MNVAIARGGDLAERHAQGQRDYQAADGDFGKVFYWSIHLRPET